MKPIILVPRSISNDYVLSDDAIKAIAKVLLRRGFVAVKTMKGMLPCLLRDVTITPAGIEGVLQGFKNTAGLWSSVITIAVDNPPTDWTPEIAATRRFGVRGRVIACHDSHGECFTVKHDDGTQSAYERRELYVVPLQ